jgi:ribosomal protein L31
MKYTLLILSALMFLFYSCSKKEDVKLTAFSSEAFAYNMGDSSEVDATTRVKGFKQEEKKDGYYATLAYDVDLITPKGDTVKSIISKVVDKIHKEKMTDTQLEAQFDIDSTYKNGNYKVLFRIKDALSGKTTTSVSNFSLGN